MTSHVLMLFILLGSPADGAEQKKSATIETKTSTPTAKPQETPLSPSKWTEVYNIIDTIKNQNTPQSYRITLRSGPIQTSTNNQKDVLDSSALPALGAEIVANIWNNLGIEIRGLYAQNSLASQSDINNNEKQIYWLDGGLRYTVYFDNTRLDDTVSFKVLYHDNSSNFTVSDPTTQVFINHYAGLAFGVERSIPITKKLGVVASFELLQTFQATGPSNLKVQQYGYGFNILGEIYYLIHLFDLPIRMGVSYWQQGNENELVQDSDKSSLGKNSYFQLSRAVFGNISVLF